MRCEGTSFRPARAIGGVGVLACALGLVACDSPQSPLAPSPMASPPAASASPDAPTPAATITSIFGFVIDTAFRPLAGARVEVLDGPAAGTSAIADANGAVSLSGVFDANTRFRATLDGHVAATQTWRCSVATCPGPTRANPWLGFYLAVEAAPVDIAGEYTLTLAADPACTDVPEHARNRRYPASVR